MAEPGKTIPPGVVCSSSVLLTKTNLAPELKPQSTLVSEPEVWVKLPTFDMPASEANKIAMWSKGLSFTSFNEPKVNTDEVGAVLFQADVALTVPEELFSINLFAAPMSL